MLIIPERGLIGDLDAYLTQKVVTPMQFFEKGCLRQHNYRVERRLKNRKNEI